jgi:oligopeptide/dipeptide ABC transporter ATP-binding protein
LALPPLLELEDLSITYRASPTIIRAVRNVSLQIREGETLALVGETGSGKSTLALALMGLLGYRAQVESGKILFEGRHVQSLSRRDWKRIRSERIGIVFQDARGALNPVLSIWDHLIETLRAHQELSRRSARARAAELLQEVGISEDRGKMYPFELSGGACQRVGIALAICNNPRLLIADEPTSAVDSTIQAQIIDLLRLMKQHHSLALLLISHDLPLISQVADRISVMYHGRIVESGLREEVLASPAHPYTRGLVQSQPGLQHHHETHPLTAIPGAMPIPGEDLPGCPFAPRCSSAKPRCREALPAERELSATHWEACIRDSDDRGVA